VSAGTRACVVMRRAIIGVLLLHGVGLVAGADDGFPSPSTRYYPLAGIRNEADLRSRMLSNGGWLAGLPGHPNYTGSNVHAGIDIRAQLGEPVIAVLDGIVDPASDTPHNGYGPGWTVGRVMIVRSALPDGTSFLLVYGHTQNHRVKGGDVVHAGDMLCEIGPWLVQEGGPHLHLTLRFGELPRWGWGTPTLPGKPLRDGAECAGSEEEVLALGYRNPLPLLLGGGVTPPQAVTWTAPPYVDPVPADLRQRFGLLCEALWRRLAPEGCAIVPYQPLKEQALKSADMVRWGKTWTRTFVAEDGEVGAAMWPDGTEDIYWIGGPIWQAYAKAGGPDKLGMPCSIQHDWGDCIAQSYSNALIVYETATKQVRVIFRSRPDVLR